MKNIQKLLVVLIALSITTGVYAQKIGIKGGLNLSTMLVQDDNITYSEDFEMLPGFHIGVTADFPMTDWLSFEPGVFYSTKGYKISGEGALGSYEYTQTLSYVEIPLNVKLTFDLGFAKIYGTAGPYLGYGIAGNGSAEGNVEGFSVSGETDISWGNDELEDDLKPLDYGLMFGAGLDINNIQIGATYGLGLANISPITTNNYKINNQLIAISIGYRF